MGCSFEFTFNGNIQVQTMERQAGIFIGERNNAIGWSAHGKTNNVIGDISGESNYVYQNLLILNDPDVIDTPIDDRDINVSFANPGNENTSTINLDSINVASMERNNVVTVGEGHITGMDANDKLNHAYGSTYGNANHSIANVAINTDNDVIDSIIDDQDVKIANITRV